MEEKTTDKTSIFCFLQFLVIKLIIKLKLKLKKKPQTLLVIWNILIFHDDTLRNILDFTVFFLSTSFSFLFYDFPLQKMPSLHPIETITLLHSLLFKNVYYKRSNGKTHFILETKHTLSWSLTGMWVQKIFTSGLAFLLSRLTISISCISI